MELSVLQEYDQILLGNRVSTLDDYLFSTDYNEKVAMQVIKYALTYYLNWDADDVYNHFSYEIIKQMKLEYLYKYITFPCELDKDKDYYYMAYILFPREYHISKTELAIQVYKKMLNNELAKFPKEYLSGQLGVIRASACFQYMLSNYLPFNNIDDLYKTFYSPEGIKILKKYKLASACNDLFEHPIDFLHEALPRNKKNYFLYHHYKYILTDKSVRRKEKLHATKQKKE